MNGIHFIAMCCIIIHYGETQRTNHFDANSMLEKFANYFLDDNVWKYTRSDENHKLSNQTLHIIAVPFSHLDPGWGMPYVNYYNERVKDIFDNMVNALDRYPKMTYIIAEVAFLELWWKSNIIENKRKLLKLIHNGQLEIVGGGWVMADEATTHYYSIVEQFILGHHWLKENLNYTPTYYWSIDSFGHSSAMRYLLNRAGINGSFINRIHYALKNSLATIKTFIVNWQQQWDMAGSGKTEHLCYILPTKGYDTRNNCGPDPVVCDGFNYPCNECDDYELTFRHSVTEKNAVVLAEKLLQQYRQLASLIGQNTLFILLGNDFAYKKEQEFKDTYNNYTKLFDIMNKKPEWNVQARFGTTREYFEYLRQEIKHGKSHPILQGDFFVYADEIDVYWSGYYSSAMDLKRLERTLMTTLRSAEIAYSLAQISTVNNAKYGSRFLTTYEKIETARVQLSLMQHHDAITGTSNNKTNLDFLNRLKSGMEEAYIAMATSLSVILNLQDDNHEWKQRSFDRFFKATFTEFYVKTVDSERIIMLFNSLMKRRTELTCFRSTTPTSVFGSGGQIISEIHPVLTVNNGIFAIKTDEYEVCFEPLMAPLEVKSFKLVDYDEVSELLFSTLKTNTQIDQPLSRFRTATLTEKTFQFHGNHWKVTFSSKTGLPIFVKFEDITRTLPLKINLKIYTDQNSLKNGKYILSKKTFEYVMMDNNSVVISEGTLSTKIYVQHPEGITTITLRKNGRTMEIKNTLISHDERSTKHSVCNFDRVLHISTEIQNKKVFFTDSNGLQMMKRHYMDNLPYPANVYPFTTVAFVQDELMRMNILTAQASGITSLETGSMEVFLDRRSCLDDEKGIIEMALPVATITTFFCITFDHLDGTSGNDQNYDSLTLETYQESNSFQYPLMLVPTKSHQRRQKSSFLMTKNSIPINFHMVAFRSLKYAIPEGVNKPMEFALIIHRTSFKETKKYAMTGTCSSPSDEILLEHMLPNGSKSIQETTLTLMSTKKNLQITDRVKFFPMELKTFRFVK